MVFILKEICQILCDARWRLGLGLIEPDPETDSQEVCDSFKLPSENVLPGLTFEGMVIVALANL
jgi:hypothetical protein